MLRFCDAPDGICPACMAGAIVRDGRTLVYCIHSGTAAAWHDFVAQWATWAVTPEQWLQTIAATEEWERDFARLAGREIERREQ